MYYVAMLPLKIIISQFFDAIIIFVITRRLVTIFYCILCVSLVYALLIFFFFSKSIVNIRNEDDVIKVNLLKLHGHGSNLKAAHSKMELSRTKPRRRLGFHKL